jgi:hypothetical protein
VDTQRRRTGRALQHAIIRTDEQRREMETELRARFDEIAVLGVLEMPMTVRGTVARRRARR